ncbi:hypothetical protein BP5796_13145 [Coleophoma crateriformis]|uniref:Uncharacterized protein n=1 Tax=Coleophoma crateriformis TaxID=565419 RepID=A0A3D8Q524_9HELO|nr:hypothetical protein BP5796_13145 [Coleophoma crateriformis]
MKDKQRNHWILIITAHRRSTKKLSLGKTMKRIVQKVSERKDNSSIKTSKTLSSITHWNKDIAILYDPNTKKAYKGSVSEMEEQKDNEPFQLVPLPKSGGTMPLVIKAKSTDQTIDMGSCRSSKATKAH